jgi:protein translocase SecG subunit
MMEKILMITQAVIAILLSLVILVQSKDEGLSASFNANQSFTVTRRGPEKVLFLATIVLAVLFLVNSLLFVFAK